MNAKDLEGKIATIFWTKTGPGKGAENESTFVFKNGRAFLLDDPTVSMAYGDFEIVDVDSIWTLVDERTLNAAREESRRPSVTSWSAGTSGVKPIGPVTNPALNWSLEEIKGILVLKMIRE